ncbi:MAG: DNRLRE domain-containing protein [Burkholderiaceae bacterium]|jgi:hypothetical protein|nr:DNRLRE domain-containing protein [Burkholderiaceae bacterium]
MRLVAGAAVLAMFAACGGSGTDGTPPSLERKSTNWVVHNDAPSVEQKGAFNTFAGYLSGSATSLRAPAGGRSSARFDLGKPEAGFYELFAWWPQTGGEGSEALVRVEHAGGVHASRVDQSVQGGQWNSLGVYELGRGDSAITFEQVDGKPMLVDSVRAFYVGAQRPELALGAEQLPIAEDNQEYWGQLEPRNGVPPYAFRVLDPSSLPSGLALDAATGVVTGRPAFVGSHTFSVEVVDALGRRVASDVTINVIESLAPPPPPAPFVPKASTGEASSLVGKSAPTPLADIVAAMPEGSWKRVNRNEYSSVWVPRDLRSLVGKSIKSPEAIILAWSSFAWDSNRGNLLLYGGGHANYRGNEVYLWRGSTQLWERASLPSESVQDILGNRVAIDGAENAPSSAHTYDNTMFLPLLDRMLVLGGAADSNGGHYRRANDDLMTSRNTGPYLFDPNLAHPDRVGGTTGSHVQRVNPYPEIVGGNMWVNRDNWLNASRPTEKVFTDGCTAYAEEGGKDVVYMYVKTSPLYRYTIKDLANSSLDTWERVGRYWGGPGDQTSCGYDPVGKSFVRVATNSVPFVFWDLNRAGTTNNDVKMSPDDPTGEFTALLTSTGFEMRDCGLDFDPKRGNYRVWCGGGTVWTLQPPALLSAAGWSIRKAVLPQGAVPTGDTGTGILGKWKYARDLDAFIALQDPVAGNVWVYKPVGWQGSGGGSGGGGGTPPNVVPSVSLVAPLAGTEYIAGSPISIGASASDPDGSITQVEFFANGIRLGASSSSPYAINWATAPAGTHALTAIATDNDGARSTSAAVTITVRASGGGGGVSTEVELQRGLGNYAGAAETYLSSWHPSISFGATYQLQDQKSQYTSLLRFAIFQSEGGPVPNGATIESATLSLYKYTAYNMVYALHRLLKPWDESTANWRQTGVSGEWALAGANGAGSDYVTTPDATGSTGFESGEWMDFDLTDGVQRLSNGASNLGWRLKPVSGYTSGLKRFYTSEYATDTRFRPKLRIRYR